MTNRVDTICGDLVRSNSGLLSVLLRDCTLSTPDRQVNIFWATDDYSGYGGDLYGYDADITEEALAGMPDGSIMRRVMKHPDRQTLRSKQRAEVFTPAWLCNAQNNLVDEAWFGRKGVFNTETVGADGVPRWEESDGIIVFPKGRTWMHYVRARRLEMACGEAPYLASRHDATTGAAIPLGHRVGMLDRKFRVINENVSAAPTQANRRQWLRKAYQAMQSVYGYDWQGDNVFLAREALLSTFCEYYADRWHEAPNMKTLMKVAEIVSWNVWQMDGISCTVPQRAGRAGACCRIMEWHSAEPLAGTTVLFRNLIEK